MKRFLSRIKRIILLTALYIVLVSAFAVLLFINLYPVGSFFDGTISNSTRIYDRNGVLLYETLSPEAGRTQYVALSNISKHLINATIAAEDASFYSNSGVDVAATIRAIFQNIESGKVVSGASTITQQLVHNVLGMNRSRTVFEKMKEALLAVRVSKKYSKDKILELYLNKVYYGNLNYGISSAAYSYFGKHPRDLDSAESAFLAGLPQAPNRFDPFKYRNRALERKNAVLTRMQQEGFINQEEFAGAREQELIFEPKSVTIRAPHFVHMVIEELEDHFGSTYAMQGLHVKTTIDVNLNDTLTEIVRKQIGLIRHKNVTNGAIVVLEPQTGAIRSLVGSLDYFDTDIEGRINMATALRQPGSAIKPITYAVAFEKGWHGATELRDEPVRFFTADGQPYYPKNYDFEYHGLVTVREALANSYNIPAVHAIEFAGVSDVLQKARSMGISTLNESPDHYGLALTLGDGEIKLLDLTKVYAALAAGGIKHDAYSITEIKDENDTVLFTQAAIPGTHVIGEDIAFMVSDILSDNDARISQFGINSMLELDRPAAVKTGTTRNFKDNWTLGYTPDFVVGVWVGNTNNEPMHNVSGVMGAGPIWHEAMKEVHRGLQAAEFRPPLSVEQKIFDDTIEWVSRKISYESLENSMQAKDPDFRIIKPFDGDVFAYQSDVNPEIQQIKFEAAPEAFGEKIEWFINGQKIAEGGAFFWKIVIGEHTIKAVKRPLNKPLQEDAIKITVGL